MEVYFFLLFFFCFCDVLFLKGFMFFNLVFSGWKADVFNISGIYLNLSSCFILVYFGNFCYIMFLVKIKSYFFFFLIFVMLVYITGMSGGVLLFLVFFLIK